MIQNVGIAHTTMVFGVAMVCLSCGAARGEVAVSLTQGHPRSKQPSVRMNNGAMSYDISLFRIEEEQNEPLGAEGFVLSSMGLFPSKRGWSGSHFLSILLDGDPFLPCPFRIVEMGSGNDGTAVLRGRNAKATVTLTFRTSAMSDVLLLSVAVISEKPIEEVEIVMAAIPGEFTRWVKHKGSPFGPVDTRILTPTREVGEAAHGKEEGVLDTSRENWLFLYDANYDPEKNDVVSGEWCACGVLYNPHDMGTVTFEKHPASVRLCFTLAEKEPEAARTADFALWEFAESNAQGKRVMESLVTDP